MKLDVKRSRKLAKAVHAKDGDCFRNAFCALVHVPGGKYVEGFAVGQEKIALITHGWIETKGGRIIDPTPVWLRLPPARYFPIRKWTADQALEPRRKARRPAPARPAPSSGVSRPRSSADVRARHALPLWSRRHALPQAGSSVRLALSDW